MNKVADTLESSATVPEELDLGLGMRNVIRNGFAGETLEPKLAIPVAEGFSLIATNKYAT